MCESPKRFTENDMLPTRSVPLRRVSPANPCKLTHRPLLRQYFWSTTDWLCCDPLLLDADNDSEWEIDWLIELEYEPLPDVDPDCDDSLKLKCLLMLKLIQGRGTMMLTQMQIRCRNWNCSVETDCFLILNCSTMLTMIRGRDWFRRYNSDVETRFRRAHWIRCWYWFGPCRNRFGCWHRFRRWCWLAGMKNVGIKTRCA